MLLGGPLIQIVNNATEALAKTGVKAVITAGNSVIDAATTTPASAEGENIHTVSVFNPRERLANFINFGVVVDVTATGDLVDSLVIGGTFDVLPYRVHPSCVSIFNAHWFCIPRGKTILAP